MEDKDFETLADAFMNWRKHVVSFGFGEKTGIDLPYEKRGFVPTKDYYDRYYGEDRWKALTIISMAIGQGEILTTPLQLANYVAIIANKGYYIPPHTIKSIEGIDKINKKYTTPLYTTIDTVHYNVVTEGMEMVVNGGAESTARIARLKDIVVCGKTGTAQNPQGEDHSVFMAFAPKDDPVIALSVYVEHGKWGASYAAPIASLMIEKYINDSISPYRKWIENRMLTQNLLISSN
jgi:penicillin-binding protein 2